MANGLYDTKCYRSFSERLIETLRRSTKIRRMTLESLESKAKATGRKTKYGSTCWRSHVSSRLAGKTVYLGTDKVVLPNATPHQEEIVRNAPDELEKVLHLLEALPFFHLQRQMGDNGEYNPVCNLYVCVADPKNYRLGYMWGHTMFKNAGRPGPEFTMIHIPEEHTLRQQILSIPEHNINVALGTDYMGEDKKGFLRQAMWSADRLGMLGLHSGTKQVLAMDEKTGKLKTWGAFMFGLTATGKSTWSCHQLGFDPARGEKTLVSQDDICFLRPDGSAYGSEDNYYVKTDVMPDQQEAMYNALIDKSCLMENVHVKPDGSVDFLDESLCGNGRAIVHRRKLKVRQGGRMVGIDAPSVNLPPLSELDGLLFAFITRRNTIMPFAQELTAEQAVLAYLWGESSHSMATNPAKAGESVRIVGTDDFIMGSRAFKVNRFWDIVMGLKSRFPDKVKFMLYNTGGMGEIIEETKENGRIKKKVVRKTGRVPLDLMAAIQRGDLRGTNSYEPGRLGTREITHVEGKALTEYDATSLYSQEQIDGYVHDLVAGRRKFTEEISREGLRQEVLDAAEASFSIDKAASRSTVALPGRPWKPEPAAPPAETLRYEYEPKNRPRRDFTRR